MNFEDKNPRDRARQLRAEATREEQKLWDRLRGKRLAGFRFRRQHPIGPFIADFCRIAKSLIIELDGGQHGRPEAEKEDAARTAYLEELGYRVLRFWNAEVATNIDGVLEVIYAALTNS